MSVDLHWIKTNILPDEMLELVGRNLSEPLESGNFRVSPQSFDGGITLRFIVAVEGALLVADPKKRGLEHEQMSLPDQFGEELEEEGN